MDKKKMKRAAMEILEELCKNVPTGYEVQKDAATKFINLGELADVLSDEFGVKYVDFDAASERNDGVISIALDEVVFEHGRTHPFFEYIKSADFLSFSQTDEGLLEIRLVVKDLVKVSE